MSKDLERFADDLADEALMEAASTFFGIRKRMDEEIEFYQTRFKELLEVRSRVMERAATVQMLLCGRENAARFYAAIGVAPGGLLEADKEAEPLNGAARRKALPKPMALTRAGAYVKLTLAAYAALQDRMDEYLHGRFYPDPRGSGHKLVNAYYGQIVHWCAAINERVRKINENMPPSGTRQFVKRLDPALLDKERLMDAPLDDFSDVFDKELALTPVDCSELDGLGMPELPPGYKVRDDIAALCKDIYDARRDEIQEILEHWEG